MLVGNVDLAERDQVAGWAADTDRPDEPIDVTIEVDGKLLAHVRADKPRMDLRDRGTYGAGHHGFHYKFAEPLTPGRHHDLVVRFASTGESLGRGKVRLLPDSAPDHASAAPPLDAPNIASSTTSHPGYVIHIGLPKTGTKYLQQWFCRDRDRLAAEGGIYYPTEFWPKLDIFAHHELLKELACVPSEKLEHVFQKLNASGAKKVLLSCEGFIGISPKTLEYLSRLTGTDNVQIVFYARRWSDWIPSQWQQTIKQGATETFPEMYARTLETAFGDFAINYTHILDKFAAVFGHKNITVVSYSNLLDTGQDIFVHFVNNILGLPRIAPRRVELIHESMGPYLTELAVLIHRIAGIRWRVSHRGLILFTDWVSRPFHSPDHTEPHPPCTMIRLSRSGFQPSDARKSLLRSMVAVSPRMAV